MKYILVLYDYDSNLIAARAMKSNKGAASTDAYESIYAILTDTGITPILQYLDNETSKELITTIKKNNLKYQLAAPHDHQLNLAERAVTTFKNHFIAVNCYDRSEERRNNSRPKYQILDCGLIILGWFLIVVTYSMLWLLVEQADTIDTLGTF